MRINQEEEKSPSVQVTVTKKRPRALRYVRVICVF